MQFFGLLKLKNLINWHIGDATVIVISLLNNMILKSCELFNLDNSDIWFSIYVNAFEYFILDRLPKNDIGMFRDKNRYVYLIRVKFFEKHELDS